MGWNDERLATPGHATTRTVAVSNGNAEQAPSLQKHGEINRRISLSLPFVVFGLIFPKTSFAASRLEILTDLAKAIGEAGTAIAKIGDGVSHLIEIGDHGYQTIKARNTRNKLVDLSGSLSFLLVNQKTGMYKNMRDYLADPTPLRWAVFINNVNDILPKINDLITQIKEDRSDLVLTPSYEKLIELLATRKTLLQQLQKMTTPNTPDELAALRLIAEKYDALIESLSITKDKINEYIVYSYK